MYINVGLRSVTFAVNISKKKKEHDDEHRALFFFTNIYLIEKFQILHIIVFF